VTGYFIRRFIQALATILIVTVVSFGMIHLVPGGAVHLMLGKNANNQADVAAVTHLLGLDRPLPVQYWNWLVNLLHGNFGFDYFYSQSVGSLMLSALGASAYIITAAIILSVAIAIPMGVLQAIRRNTWVDHTITTFSFIAYGIPTFFLGLAIQQFVQDDLRLIPVQTQVASFTGALTHPFAVILPIATLVIGGVASYSRYMRSAMLDQITQDYVRTAIAKGAHRRRVIYGHVLRNALIPMVTLVGLSLPGLAGGTLIVEYVFNVNGIGLLSVKGALDDDYVLVLGSTVIVSIAAVVGSFLADLSYAALDPRVRLDS
jgi:peptide/nickel transport system permease protein